MAIPDALRPWVGWVLHDTPDIVCPFVGNTRVCAWPSVLELRARADGASFRFEVYTDRSTKVALPGSRDYWPQRVRVGQRAATTLASYDTPNVELPAGQHVIEGEFVWSTPPEFLTIPTNIGRVELVMDGAPVRARVDDAGRLWLSDGATGERAETDSLRVAVHRRIDDGVPVTVTTWLQLNVSGSAREVELGPVLLPGSIPTFVDAQLPVQVGADGSTKVFVRPGSHDVKLHAVLAQPVHELTVPERLEHFDAAETWVWLPTESVRSVEPDGLVGIDAERTSLPAEWRGNTTFVAPPGAKLTLNETRRGMVEMQPNAVNLSRTFWLDLDGHGYTVRDQLTGRLNEGWRLDYVTGNGALGRVATDGDSMLITTNPDNEYAGVELRDAAINLEAEVRIENALTQIHVVGWDHDVQSLDATLHLPPGWLVLGATGVDAMNGTWVASWTLWDLLFVLLVAVVIGRLYGWKWGAIAFLALGVTHGQFGAPRWVWIHLIASLALLRVLPDGHWRRVVVAYRGIALVVLAVLLSPFIRDQFFVAFNPQVVEPARHRGFTASLFEAKDFASGSVQARYELDEAAPKSKPEQRLQQIDPNAVVQTGPGLPTWSWQTWDLQWNGPVAKDHVVTLWLLTPALNTVVALLRIVLSLFLALLLVAPRDMYWRIQRPAPDWWRRLFGGVAAVLLAFGAAASAPTELAAQTLPDAQLLQQLRERLDLSSQCEDPCVVASNVAIVATGLELELTADVSAERDSAWMLPGPADLFDIKEVLVDGRPSNQLRRVDNFVQVRVPAGHHAVRARGVLLDRTSVTLQFEASSRPRRVSFTADGWTVEGLSPTGTPDSSLQLTRTDEPHRETDVQQQAELPPWFAVERTLALGMPWQTTTRVYRRTTERPQLVRVPLLAGEKLISDGLRVEGGQVLVDFARGQDTVEYTSELPITEKISLTSPANKPWTETWFVECSRIWRCSFEGVPPITVTRDGVWQPMWQPWPGEELAITVDRPLGTEGSPKTLVDVRYDVVPGRLIGATLTFTARASQGGWQEVTLPHDARLQSVSINGSERSIRPQDGVVRLPIAPGESTYALNWHQPGDNSIVSRAPPVNIGSDAANVHVSIKLPSDRWLITTQDDRMPWGPAVLFWWSLLLTLVIAIVLGLVPNLPLKWWEWGLLALGTSQLGVVALLPLVAWFVTLSWRKRHPLTDWYVFNLVQLTSLFVTLIALITLYAAVHTNLVLNVDMQVAGNDSSNTLLSWYIDRAGPDLPTPAILSLPLLVYRGISFLWALWLALMIARIAKWGWDAFSTGGRWRQPVRRGKNGAAPETAAPAEPTPEPVERNARDGVLVHVEHTFKGRVASPIEEPEDGEANVDEEDDINDISTDDVIDALLGGEEE